MENDCQEILLTVRALTHSEISEEREAFVRHAVGRHVFLRPSSRLVDEMAVEAFVGTKQVGCVASEDLWLCWQAFDALDGGGAETAMLRGIIVGAEEYRLTVQLMVPSLAKSRQVVSKLKEWEYSGPVMYRTREETKLEFLSLRLSGNLADMEAGEVLELLDAFCRLAIHDLSREGQAFRKTLRTSLSACKDKRLQAAAGRIDELSRRMGGNTYMEQLGHWLKEELTASDEALGMPVSRYHLRRLVGEASRLPKDMLELWHSNPAQLARIIYGMHAQRADIRRALSCLIWIELRERELGQRVDNLESALTFSEMAEYCKRCVAWDDAKPIVAMMRQHTLNSGKQSDMALADSIETEFRHRSQTGINVNTDKTEINVLSPGNMVGNEIYKK